MFNHFLVTKQSQPTLVSNIEKHYHYITNTKKLTELPHYLLEEILRDACYGFKIEGENLIQSSQNLYNLKKFVSMNMEPIRLIEAIQKTIKSELKRINNIPTQKSKSSNQTSVRKYINPLYNLSLQLKYYKQQSILVNESNQLIVQFEKKIEDCKKAIIEYLNYLKIDISFHSFLDTLEKQLEKKFGRILQLQTTSKIKDSLQENSLLKIFLSGMEKQNYMKFQREVINHCHQIKINKSKKQEAPKGFIEEYRMKIFEENVRKHFEKSVLNDSGSLSDLSQKIREIALLLDYQTLLTGQVDQILYSFEQPDSESCEKAKEMGQKCGCYIQYLLECNKEVFIDNLKTELIQTEVDTSSTVRNQTEATSTIQISPAQLALLKNDLSYEVNSHIDTLKHIKKNLLRTTIGYIVIPQQLFQQIISDEVIEIYQLISSGSYEEIQKLSRNLFQHFGQFIPVKSRVGIYYLDYQEQKYFSGGNTNTFTIGNTFQLQKLTKLQGNLLNKNIDNKTQSITLRSKLIFAQPRIITREKYKITVEYTSEKIQNIINQSKIWHALNNKYYFICGQYQTQNREIINLHFQENPEEILLRQLYKSQQQYKKWALEEHNIQFAHKTIQKDTFLEFQQYIKYIALIKDWSDDSEMRKMKAKLKMLALLSLKIIGQNTYTREIEKLLEFFQDPHEIFKHENIRIEERIASLDKKYAHQLANLIKELNIRKIFQVVFVEDTKLIDEIISSKIETEPQIQQLKHFFDKLYEKNLKIQYYDKSMLKQKLGMFNQKYSEWQKGRKQLIGYRNQLQSQFTTKVAITKSIQTPNDKNKGHLNLYHSDEIQMSNQKSKQLEAIFKKMKLIHDLLIELNTFKREMENYSNLREHQIYLRHIKDLIFHTQSQFNKLAAVIKNSKQIISDLVPDSQKQNLKLKKKNISLEANKMIKSTTIVQDPEKVSDKYCFHYRMLVYFEQLIQQIALTQRRFTAIDYYHSKFKTNKIYSVRFKNLHPYTNKQGTKYLKGILIVRNKQLHCRLKFNNKLGFYPSQNIEIELEQIELNAVQKEPYFFLNYEEYLKFSSSILKVTRTPEKKALFYLIESNEQMIQNSEIF